jgi:hypothetical protein
MTRKIALTALAAPGFPPRRSTTRSTRRRTSFHGHNRAQRPGLPVSDARRRGRARYSRQDSPGHCPGPRIPPRRPQRPRPATSPGPAAPARPPPRPAVPRRTRPGSQHRPSPRTRDGERQLPAPGRLVNGIIPAAGSTPPSGPGMVPGHAGDPGTAPPVLAPHDDLHIGHDRR